MTMTSARVSYLYDLMDAAYDAAAIHDQSRALGHAPIVDRNFRADRERGVVLPKLGDRFRTPGFGITDACSTVRAAANARK